MADLFGMLQAASGSGGGEPDPFFNQTTLLLHGDGTNGAQNNTFLDSSTNNFTITRNGNTTQGTFSPFSNADGEWSVNTGTASSNGISFADNAALQMGTGDFTIEGWFRPTATGSIRCFYTKGVNTAGGLIVGCSQSQIFCRHTGTTDLTYAATLSSSVFSHIAWVRSGSTLSIYLNGVSVASATVSFNQNDSSTVYIGAPSTLGADANRYYGDASNFRIVKGTALYTTTFTPSTTPLTNISGTSLLVFQSNRFKDNSSNAFAATVFGTPSVQPFNPFAPSAAYSPSVNGGSGYFDGTGDYLTTPTSGQFTAAGDFTVSCWFMLQSFSSSYYVVAGNWSAGTSDEWLIQIQNNGAIRFLTAEDGTFSSAGVVRLNEWTFFSASRSGSTVTVQVNGTTVRTYTKSGTFGSASKSINIGQQPGNNWPFNGYITALRLVSGSAITGVPTAPPSPTGSSLCLLMQNAGIFDNTGKNNLETVGNAQIDTGTKKYGTGSMEFDGTGDRLLAPSNPNFDFGSGNWTIECWVNPSSLASINGVFAKRLNADTTVAWMLSQIGTNGTITTLITTNGSSWGLNATTTSAVSASTWTHLAWVRNSADVSVYVGGVKNTLSGSFSGSIFAGTEPFVLGATGTTGSFLVQFNGYIDDLRITKGVARYTAAFTPPDAPFPDQ